MPRLEFETLDKLKNHLAQSTELTGAVFQSLDLTKMESELATATLRENVLLGCNFNDAVLRHFDRPLIFPQLPDLPFNPYRSLLYSPEELLGGYQIGDVDSYRNTIDGASYHHYIENRGAASMDAYVTLARRLHDHAMTDALQEYIADKKVVAIMGGHSVSRDEPVYLKIARLAKKLVHAGFLPTSGGGPGLMEATHLGAWFAERSDDDLVDAVKILSKAPLYDPIGPWLDTAFTVAEKYPVKNRENCQSLGIPTWLYGHEPPSCFALHIAKYFANSVREEGLLAIAAYGVIFAPGSAGTIQEIFQDAAQNHYKTFGHASPMIFLDEEYWTVKKPTYPLLVKLAEGHDYGQLLSITDSGETALEQVISFAGILDSDQA